MCFVPKKKLENMQKSIDELTRIIKTQELNKLREESKELKETKRLISNIKFKVKDVKTFDGEELGKKKVRITYQLPTITLDLDENGQVCNKDEFFYATNFLEMIDIEDMKTIQRVLNKENQK